jgi:META domain-containing protein
MACPSMELESRYARTLAAVRQFRVEREELVLEANGTRLARLVAQAGDSH